MGLSWSDLDPTNPSGTMGKAVDEQGEAWGPLTGNDAKDRAAQDVRDAAAQDQEYNFPDVVGPLGSQDVEIDPATGNVKVKQTLSPEQQRIVDSLYGQYGNGGQDVADAMYARATSRLDPQWDRREEMNRTRLLNQGFSEGDAGSRNAMADFGMARNDAYAQAQNNATLAGSQEQQRIIDAIMQASNPGLHSYWGNPNNADAAVAAGNLEATKTSPLDAILGIGGAIAGA